MSISFEQNSLVWQTLSEYNNISEEQARKICQDFTDVNIFLNPDAPASVHLDDIQGICMAMDNEDIRHAILQGNEEISYIINEDEDPFFYNTKIDSEKIDKHLIQQKGVYSCSICAMDDLHDGVSLSCNHGDRPCHAIYCRGCVSQWLTMCVARCPNCRGFSKPITAKPTRDIISLTSKTTKKKIVISVKRK